MSIRLQEDVDQLERVRQAGARVIRGVENMSYEERLKDLGLFSLGN